MKIAIYDRFATDNHAGRDALAADRLHKMRTWCEQNGHQILGEYIEQGHKHVGDDRPAFQRLQDDVFSGNHTIEAIVVLDYSRLFRDHVKGALFERKLRAHTVKLITMANDQGGDQGGDVTRGILERSVHTLRTINQRKAPSS